MTLLFLNGKAPDPTDKLLQYTRPGTYERLRVEAFSSLFRLGGLANPVVWHYVISTLRTEPSPYIKSQILYGLAIGLGTIALKSEAMSEAHLLDDGGIIEEDAAEVAKVQIEAHKRASIEGAINGLRQDISSLTTISDELWEFVKYV